MTGLLDKLRLLVLIVVLAAVATAAPRAQEVLFWPNTLDGTSRYFGDRSVSLPDVPRSDGTAVNGLNFEPPSLLFDSQWADFASELDKDTGADPPLRDARTLPDAPNRFLLGDGRLGIQTEKSIRGSDPLRRNECTTDDECAEYSSLPKSEPGKRNLKTLRKPFIGLSITRPLQ